MHRRCGCHGVSGSCATRFCSIELSPFRVVGARLRKKYETAVQAKMEYIGARHTLVSSEQKTTSVSYTELVYLNQSPTYCETVSGRRCKNKKNSKGSCTAMCCGRGYRAKEHTLVKNCHCRFIWCCKVICQKCIRKQKVFTCK